MRLLIYFILLLHWLILSLWVSVRSGQKASIYPSHQSPGMDAIIVVADPHTYTSLQKDVKHVETFEWKKSFLGTWLSTIVFWNGQS